MGKPTKKQIVKALLERHGRAYCQELGIDIARNTPSPLFRWLCASILFSTRISSDLAIAAAKALAKEGWTTPEKMSDTSWSQRTRALNRSGYARYDESTSRMLGATTDLLLDDYGGDLRELRQEAEREPGTERALLKKFKGLGDVGVDIFFREAQAAWPELYPFVDKKALAAAQKLGLGKDARALSRLVGRATFPRLVTGLVRASLEKDYDEIVEQAAS